MVIYIYIRLLVFFFSYLYQVFYFIRIIIYAIYYSSFLYPNIFMHFIHPYFTSIHMLYFITHCTYLCILYATHRLLIYPTDTCIYAFILSRFQVMYQIHSIVPLLCLFFPLIYQLYYITSLALFLLPFMYYIYSFIPLILFFHFVIYYIKYSAAH